MAAGDKSRSFKRNPDVTLEQLAQGIEQFLMQSEGMVCQMFQTPAGITIQTKKQDDWKKYVLMDNALQINMSEMGDVLNVQIGGAKWISKGAAMGVGLLVAWPIGVPLMALSAIGGFGVMKLPDKILGFVDQFIMNGGASAMAIPQWGQAGMGAPPMLPGEASAKCSKCGNPLSPGKKFCPECGAPTAHKKSVCPFCNAEFSGEPKFCPDCGRRLAE
ncbi:MAG: zinc ribbon domain-containing protein [Clostridiales bacterium]|jgi:hypothetical protein|nr:zinc ribbon domain-containing protein [Clostridiales bacterium]